jgi:predicted nucleic acid-binding protein
MTILRFLDTNILLYSISRDPAEARKRDCAIALAAPLSPPPARSAAASCIPRT